MDYQLIIAHESKVYMPPIVDDVIWETELQGVPGKLTFKMIVDKEVKFEEGDAVAFKCDNKDIFYGFIFTLKYDRDNIVSVTAYDQLRYLKNKDTRVIEEQYASDIIMSIAEDFNLQVGTLQNTNCLIEYRIEQNQTLFDIIQNALDTTLLETGEFFILFDEFGKLTLKNIKNMKLKVGIDAECAENFEYETTIDNDTYNKIKSAYINEEAGKIETYIAQHEENMNKWGVLQYYEELNGTENAKSRVAGLLDLYNQKTRTISIQGVCGHTDVRCGCLIPILLEMGDITLNNYMLITSCKHTFSENSHTIDMTVWGNDIYG